MYDCAFLRVIPEWSVQSHTEDDLYLSVERGLWATQSHNEPVLDQAFRTAEGVYLIFSANRSGGTRAYAVERL